MSDTEIRTLLDDGKAVAGMDTSEGSLDFEPTPPPPPPSPTVMATDRWTRRAGARLAESWRSELCEPHFTPDDGTRRTKPETPPDLDLMCDANVAADAIETLLAVSPELATNPADTHRAKWWKQLAATPEAAALRARTMGSVAVAEIAASEIAGQWARYVVEHPPKPPASDDGSPGMAKESDGDDDESPEETIGRMRSTREALKKASDSADLAESCGAGLGLPGGETDKAQLAKYTRSMRANPQLAKIMRMAGRFIAKAQRLQKQRSNLPGMEVTGVELSGDLARMLPLEVAKVAGVVPELETLALLQLAERRTLSYKRTERAPKSMGPIVVSVDESGSMTGPKVAAAKGLALAMASIARAQKRPFVLAGYSDSVHIRIADPTPDGIIEWCGAFLNGGSDLDMPLESIRPHWPAGDFGKQADHIIISDAMINAATPEWLADYSAWAKAGKIRTFSIILGHNRAGPFKTISDGGIWCVPSLDIDAAGVDAILSIGPTT